MIIITHHYYATAVSTMNALEWPTEQPCQKCPWSEYNTSYFTDTPLLHSIRCYNIRLGLANRAVLFKKCPWDEHNISDVTDTPLLHSMRYYNKRLGLAN